MMTDSEKLDFLIRSIVMSGGPKQTNGMPDEFYMAELNRWMMYFTATFYSPKTKPVDAIGSDHCQCNNQDKSKQSWEELLYPLNVLKDP